MDAGASVGTIERVNMNHEKSRVKARSMQNGLQSDLDPSVQFLSKTLRIRASRFEDDTRFVSTKMKSRKSCRKLRYRDLDEAIEALHRIIRYRMYADERGQVLTHRLECRAYFCPNCQGAHLTSQSDEERGGESYAA
jgi:hypothetical protein